jgi:hypothetical protein
MPASSCIAVDWIHMQLHGCVKHDTCGDNQVTCLLQCDTIVGSENVTAATRMVLRHLTWQHQLR